MYPNVIAFRVQNVPTIVNKHITGQYRIAAGTTTNPDHYNIGAG